MLARKGLLALFLTGPYLAALPSLCQALTFDLRLSTGGVTVLPGGIVEAPPVNALARHPSALRLRPTATALLAPGESVQLDAVSLYDDFHSETVTAHPDTDYFAADSTVAAVTATGLVTVAGAGRTSIGVIHNDEISVVEVFVLPDSSIQSISPVFNLSDRGEFDPTPEPEGSIELSPGGSAVLDTFALLSTGEDLPITGNSSLSLASEDVSVAIVDARGIVHAVGLGQTRIIAQSHGVSTAAYVRVALPDIRPPETALAISQSPVVAVSSGVFISSSALVDLAVLDPSGGGAIVSGVIFTGYTTDSAPDDLLGFRAYRTSYGTSSFRLAEGVHALRWGSIDKAGNREAVKSTTVLVDATPPAGLFRIAGPSFTDALGRVIISTSTFVVLEAQDPVSAGVASGVGSIRFDVDGAASQAVAGSSFTAFTLTEGRHGVSFEAQDRVGNASAQGSFEVLVDTTGPRLDEPLVSPAGQATFVSISNFVSVLSVDARVRAQDLVSGLSPGLISARLSRDGGQSFMAVGPPSLSGSPGSVEPQFLNVSSLAVVESQSPSLPRNLLEVSATDLAGNKSRLIIGILADVTRPGISVISPASESLLNTRRPELVLAYSDALSGIDPASLVVEIDGVRIPASGGSSEARFTTPPLADGPHEAVARIADRAGNLSLPTLVRFTIDATPPSVIVREPPAGSFFNTSTRTITANYSDFGSGLNTGSLGLFLDGAPLAVDLPGPLGPWEAAAPLPQAQFAFGLESWERRLYAMGGEENGQAVAGVFSAEVSPAGELGAWTASASLPVRLRRFASAAVNGVVYVLGGAAGAFSPSAAVYFSRVQPDGSLGTWQQTTSLPAPLFGLSRAATTVCGPYLYVMGGAVEGSSSPRADVYYARVNADGSLGAWTATTFLPEARLNPRAVEFNKRVYVLGGDRLEGAFHVPQRSVYVGEVQPGGRILNWSRTTDMLEPRSAGAAVSGGGVIAYLAGDKDKFHAPSTGTFLTSIKSDGTLEPWMRGPGLPHAVIVPGAAAVEGTVYLAGAHPVTIGHVAFKAPVTDTPAAATATFTASGLSEGAHEAAARASDEAGNLGEASSPFGIDFTAPLSTFAPQGFSRSLGGKVHVSGAVPLSILAVDPVSAGVASGVKETFLKKDSGSLELLAGSFSLADGTRTIAFQSRDNAGNLESLKSALLRVDSVAPDTVMDLFGHSPTTSSLALGWTSVGDDGMAGVIESGETLVQVSTQGPAFSTASAGVVMTLTDQGFGQGLGVRASGLEPGTTYFFALWTRDTAGNYSGTSNILTAQTLALAGSADGVAALVSPRADMTITNVSTALAPGQLAVAAGQGLQLLTTGVYELSPSGVAFSTPATLSFVIDPGGAELSQIFIYRFDGTSWDSSPVTNQAITQLAGGFIEITGSLLGTSLYGIFQVLDSTPPVTVLVIGEPKLGADPVVVSSSSSFGFAATDDRSGVRETRYAVDAEAFQVYSGSFTLAENSLHVIQWFSVDRAANTEAVQSSTVAVDAQAPALSLACPGTEGGVCSVFKEALAVRGSVFDERLARYRLESGASLISSGTENIDGNLGTWDLAALAGAQTLSLSAADLLGNAAALSRQVFVGEPARLLVFGSKKDLGQPQGVAVDNARGVVYVANTNKDEIRLYTLAGAFIKAYPDFRHPRAVAVDEGGNLYIAESGKDRIVKLSPAGSLLWAKGRSGRGPSEFRDPSGIAAGGGKVAISDTRNRRVQVLDRDGNFLQEFPIPEGPETLLPDDGDVDDDPANRKGVPVGIALDGEGRIYVADAKNRKGLAFSPDGRLIKEFGGSALFARPEGIAVSTSGECVFMSDRIKDRITKFDGTGRITLTYGTQGNIKENKPLPVETVFRRPIGLALDAVGTLWVADRNNEVIQRFGLPGALTAGGPAAAAPGGLKAGGAEIAAGAAPSAPADFFLREAYAVPNPCKACGSQGFVAQVGLADWAGLECRNMLGQVVYQNPFGGPTIKDIGNGKGAQYTYEQHWPLSGVGTGVYACVVTARKSGKPEIRKVVRTAIIR